MEIISFYFLNILVGALLALVLGLYGSHLVARNKTLEIILLGQSIQVGILIGVIVSSLVFQGHNDHGIHLEIIISILFTLLLFSFYEKITQTKKQIKTPFLVMLYTLLIAVSYLAISASPLVESHMVKAFLGDIVTASKFELYLILALSIAALFFFLMKKEVLTRQSFDLSSFGHLITNQNLKTYYVFNLMVVALMIYSIHVLGIVFTLVMMILPITLAQFNRLNLKGLYWWIALITPTSVLLGFTLNIQNDQYPTSPLIAMSLLALALGSNLLLKFWRKKSID